MPFSFLRNILAEGIFLFGPAPKSFGPSARIFEKRRRRCEVLEIRFRTR